jgi:hypothetical protein
MRLMGEWFKTFTCNDTRGQNGGNEEAVDKKARRTREQ